MKNRFTKRSRKLALLLVAVMTIGLIFPSLSGVLTASAAPMSIGNISTNSEDGNIMIFNSGQNQVMVELCTDRTVRVQLSFAGYAGYRPENPEYYMVQKNNWPLVTKTVEDKGTYFSVKTAQMEIRVEKQPLRIGMYDLSGNLLSRDTSDTGMYRDGTQVGVRRVEGTQNAGGIFGFGSGDHGRRAALNRYNQDFSEFTMSHGRVVAPFFMSSVGYGIFLNTIEKNTKFFQKGGGFQTEGYLDYFFMYGPDFKTILDEYSEITGRMEMYGKWAHGFMLSKYGNDNATQAEFSTWINRLRDDGYPADSYVFDYGWRGDVADNGGNQTGAGEKWGKQMWSNDVTKFPDIDAMFEEAQALGFKVGLHNNAGTPEAFGGKELYKSQYETPWVQSYMDSVITTGYGDWFWPDEFDVLGSNTAPTFSSKGAYEAWKDYTVESRPMFVTRGSYAGQHFATAWSGDINNTSAEIINQIGFSIDSGLIGYWATSHDLGGFMGKPNNELYTRWVSEFGAWNGIMRTHGHDGREPWLYNETAQNTLKENLKIRYALYPYIYTSAWQGYSEGVPMMRAMLLEDDSRTNPDAWDKNQQYYFGDWFLVAPAADTSDTVVSVWLPPHTSWYHYYTGELFEGGATGKTIRVTARLEEIPVFIKAGAIVPMGPDVNYADEKPLDPLTLDIYPSGTTSYTLYEDDGESRRYITENAYSTTKFTSVQNGTNISFKIDARIDNNASIYQPNARSYNLKFNNIEVVRGVTLGGVSLNEVTSLTAYNDAAQGYLHDSVNNILYVKTPDTGAQMNIVIDSDGIKQPPLGDEDQGYPPQRIEDGSIYELETAVFEPAPGGQVVSDAEWKGYTGTGFAKGFKAVGDALEFKVNVQRGGTYNLVLRVNNGKKNDPQYDNTPRTGGLYLNGLKEKDLSFAVTPTWGDAAKNGVWVNYMLDNIQLEAGVHTFRIVSEGANAGNYNLDSLTFNRLDTSKDAFAQTEAENADILTNMTAGSEGATGFAKATIDGAWLSFSEMKGENKGGVEMRLKSTTGGSVIIYENGVGDKILATVALPENGQWTTVKVDSKNTDVNESNIFLEFKAKDGGALDVSVDWFKFVRKIDAYSKINAVTADTRSNINILSPNVKLINIFNGSWAEYKDLDFGTGGLKTLMMNLATERVGGMVEVYIDDVNTGTKIAELAVTNTGSWTSPRIFMADCTDVTGVHDVFFKFRTNSGQAVCDFYDFTFSKNSVTVETEVTGGSATAQISNNMANIGDKVTVQISGIAGGYAVGSVSVTDKNGGTVAVEEIAENSRYSFILPDNTPVKVSVNIIEKIPEIDANTRFELEEGTGITDDTNTKLRVDREWAGYTGSGYVAGFKTVGNYVQFKADVKTSGEYTLTLRGAAGLKNSASFDNTPRTGALYIDGVKVADFGLNVQSSWGTWITHVFDKLNLTAGEHVFKIVSEGGSNSGNFNLDSIDFVREVSQQDKTALADVLSEAQSKTQADYTETSWNAMTVVRQAAQAVMDDSGATAEQISTAVIDLQAALENLIWANIEAVKAAIEALPDVYTLKLADETAANAQKTLFDKMNDKSKLLVTNSHKLNNLIADIAILKKSPNGDVDCNGTVDVLDIMKCRAGILGYERLTAAQTHMADIFEDSKVNIRDIMQIRKLILG